MSDVEEVKNRIRVVDLIGEYVRLTKTGSHWRALCPFHGEKTPSFMVSEERRGFHCFGCGKGGDIFTFVMEMEGIDFREALEQLAEKAGVKLARFEKGDKGKESAKPKLYNILELAAKWYEKNLWEGKGKGKILGYLRERGLNDESMKKFRLGYAPEGWRNILNFLVKKGFSTDIIEKTGLLVKKEAISNSQFLISNQIPNSKFQSPNDNFYDRFRDRIMFPVQDIMGRVVGFSARVAPGGDEKNAKYINTPQTELYDKSKILFGLHLAKSEIRKRGEVVLVEGNMDVIASHQAGFENTVAVSGTALTPEQIKIIKRYAENLKMAFDMDSAGQTAAKKSARICLENDINVRIVLLPTGKDAADAIREDKKIWQDALGKARHVLDYHFEEIFSRLDPKNPVEKKKIAKELLNVIKDIADPVEKSHWLKKLSRQIDVEEKILTEVLNRAEKKEKGDLRESAETPEKPGKKNILEKRIIGLLAAFPRETEKTGSLVRANDFSGEEEKKILEKIIGGEKGNDFDKLRNSITGYESQKLLEEAVFEVEVEARERSGGAYDPAKELKDALGRFRKAKARQKIVKIAGDIRKAEKTGDKAAVKTLMQEFQNLSEEIRE